ncbi:hypothetical protein L226DRAFT_258152 [Lentinus tigrinus ALCF2SS1-7]|uniref:Uncharacterized protein n=1 Tax=Lentinus tigrinus ALCF2SS1-6 TaxID=1328759 RepID=A0A5C2RWV5_9APHY|nr:hypothetical protein L227DRAFT_312024 [Lentinus tigrinus ALCF2SS1-6]RPD70137.1 hypothetical protein L226DRAFT_258152 [Lentinus tigrinus ALCF2SS1-7]
MLSPGDKPHRRPQCSTEVTTYTPYRPRVYRSIPPSALLLPRIGGTHKVRSRAALLSESRSHSVFCVRVARRLRMMHRGRRGTQLEGPQAPAPWFQCRDCSASPTLPLHPSPHRVRGCSTPRDRDHRDWISITCHLYFQESGSQAQHHRTSPRWAYAREAAQASCGLPQTLGHGVSQCYRRPQRGSYVSERIRFAAPRGPDCARPGLWLVASSSSSSSTQHDCSSPGWDSDCWSHPHTPYAYACACAQCEPRR